MSKVAFLEMNSLLMAQHDYASPPSSYKACFDFSMKFFKKS